VILGEGWFDISIMNLIVIGVALTPFQIMNHRSWYNEAADGIARF
jgi:hypothetical protein